MTLTFYTNKTHILFIGHNALREPRVTFEWFYKLFAGVAREQLWSDALAVTINDSNWI